MVMVKGEQNHQKTIDANGSRGKKTFNSSQIFETHLEVNNGDFLGAMGWNGFYLREPLASMVF